MVSSPCGTTIILKHLQIYVGAFLFSVATMWQHLLNLVIWKTFIQ